MTLVVNGLQKSFISSISSLFFNSSVNLLQIVSIAIVKSSIAVFLNAFKNNFFNRVCSGGFLKAKVFKLNCLDFSNCKTKLCLSLKMFNLKN